MRDKQGELKRDEKLNSINEVGKKESNKNEFDNFKIAAVVVTFNRLELLKICITALREQTRKLDEIIVINNSSSDGSLEWFFEQNDLTLITQQNSGGTGSFHTRIKTAYEKGYDWI
jgi:GT2 family glycosyltransferase